MQTPTDKLHHFLFENTPIRGNLVHLDSTYVAALAHQQLPMVIKQALGELMAASALLVATLKMNGAMVLQIQTKGRLKLLVVECSSDLAMRATAKWEGDIADDADFLTLIQQGHCIITLDTKHSEPYQGIVPIEGKNIAEMLENYMRRSQQIDTRLWLSCDGTIAAGLLVQKLPEQEAIDADAWQRITMLADTITPQELKNESAERILTRLFHEEDVRLFEAKPTRFYCQCTRENVGKMLQMLGIEEIESILSEQEEIDIHCDFCNKQYLFDAVDAATLFANGDVIKTSKAIH
jgi:molecular chaperone Hsp33